MKLLLWGKLLHQFSGEVLKFHQNVPNRENPKVNKFESATLRCFRVGQLSDGQCQKSLPP